MLALVANANLNGLARVNTSCALTECLPNE
jgi:hypothetical protein